MLWFIYFIEIILLKIQLEPSHFMVKVVVGREVVVEMDEQKLAPALSVWPLITTTKKVKSLHTWSPLPLKEHHFSTIWFVALVHLFRSSYRPPESHYFGWAGINLPRFVWPIFDTLFWSFLLSLLTRPRLALLHYWLRPLITTAIRELEREMIVLITQVTSISAAPSFLHSPHYRDTICLDAVCGPRHKHLSRRPPISTLF